MADLINRGSTKESLSRLALLLGEGRIADSGLEGDLVMVRDQFRRYADERIRPRAHAWHLGDELIPLEILRNSPTSASLGSPCLRNTAVWVSPRLRCAWSPKSSRAVTLASVHLARARRLPPSSSSPAVRPSSSNGGFRGSFPGTSSRPRSSRNPGQARISAASRPARYATATATSSPATRPGSPMPPGPIS